MTSTTTQPTVGMSVKLRKGMLRVSARQVQIITAIHDLQPDEKTPDGFLMSRSDIHGEGGYWIKTNHTKDEWWAWILFRVA